MNKAKSIAGLLFIILLAAYFGLKVYAAGIAKEKIDMALLGVEKFVKVEYKDVSVDLLSQNVHITDVVILPAKSQMPLHIAEVVIYDIDHSSQVPVFLEVAVNGIEIVLDDLDKKDAQTWQDLGISDKIKLDFAASYQYQSDDNQLHLKKLHLRGQELGELNASLHLGNLPSNTNGLLGLIPKITLYQAKISYQDDSLLERSLKAEARLKKKSVDDVKKEAIAGIEKQISLAKNDFMREALAAAKNFIADPDELSISIAPDKPVSIQQLMRMNDPARAAKKLRLSVK